MTDHHRNHTTRPHVTRPHVTRHHATRRHATWAALALLLVVSGARAAPLPLTGPLTAQIINWPAGGPGEVRLGVAYSAQNADDHLTSVIVTAPVDAQGHFTLPLPSSAGLAAMLPAPGTTYTFGHNCQGKVNVSPAARVNFFTLHAYQGGLLLSALKRESPDGIAALAFASVSTTLSGAVTCTKDSLQTWIAPLVAGWNLLWQEVGEDKDGVWQISVKGQAVPQAAFWHLYEGYIGIGIRVDSKPDNSGVVVSAVMPGEAAGAAGVKAGDQIVAVDGFQIEAGKWMQVIEQVRGDAGVPVTLTIRRGSQTLTLKIVRQFIRE